MRPSLIAAALAALALAAPVAGDTVPERSETPLALVRDGQPMKLTYQLKASAWAIILPITGKATFHVDLEPDTYRITSKVKTTGLADLLVNYDLSLSATGYTRGERLDPYAFVSQNRDGKKNRRVELTYGESDVALIVRPEFGDLGHPPATPQQKLDAHDPITALINFGLTPRAPGSDPCGGPIKVFDGRQLSYLHLEYAGMKYVRSEAWKGDALECHVRLERVAGYDKDEVEEQQNLSAIDGPIRMWLAPLDNGATMPVRIEADSKDIGKVTLQASQLKFEPVVREQAATENRGG